MPDDIQKDLQNEQSLNTETEESSTNLAKEGISNSDTIESANSELVEDYDDPDYEGVRDLLGKAMESNKQTIGAEKKKQVLDRGVNWYVIQTYTGYEEAVKKALLQRIETYNMQDQIFEVMVPKETVMDFNTKTKKQEEEGPKEVKKRIFPGYVFVKMKVNDASWYVVRNTPHITGFLGAGTVPVPVDPIEYQRIKSKMGVVDTKHTVDFKVGEIVIIKEGPFAKFEGEVKAIDSEKRKIRVMVNVFGRETPVEMDLYQVAPIT